MEIDFWIVMEIYKFYKENMKDNAKDFFVI